MEWPPRDLHIVERSLERARQGRPGVISISGTPGMGKSTLLAEIVRRASDFELVRAEATASTHHEPYALLKRVGLVQPLDARGAPKDAIVVAQDLRDLIDQVGARRPVLIAVDDLQWADPESVEALYWLSHRASKERLLVVAAMRPTALSEHPVWEWLLTDPDRGASIDLRGLEPERALALIRELDPEADERAARRLIRQTGGKPAVSALAAAAVSPRRPRPSE